MKLELLRKLTAVIPKDPSLGLTAAEIRDLFFERYPERRVIAPASRTKRISRHLRSLSDKALVKVVPKSDPCRYFVDEGRTRELLMSPEAVLSLFWSRRTLTPLMPMLGTGDTTHMGAGATLELMDRVLRDRIRIVPDGIGRHNADIDSEHLKTVVTSIRQGLMIGMRYGKGHRAASDHQVSVLGLAVKDGTIYLIASESMLAAPRHFAMQRIQSLELLRKPADRRPDFDIDRYIADQYQLSHKLDSAAPPSRLELLVHEGALFHFEERPLIDQDPIDRTCVIDGAWYRVCANVPDTVQLVPFLWSHAGYVQVLAPASIRDQVAEGLRKGASHYPRPLPSSQT